jgi:hypothetical protein
MKVFLVTALTFLNVTQAWAQDNTRHYQDVDAALELIMLNPYLIENAHKAINLIPRKAERCVANIKYIKTFIKPHRYQPERSDAKTTTTVFNYVCSTDDGPLVKAKIEIIVDSLDIGYKNYQVLVTPL